MMEGRRTTGSGPSCRHIGELEDVDLSTIINKCHLAGLDPYFLSNLLHDNVLLAELYCHLGDYASAFEHLNAHVQKVTHDNNFSFENYEYVWCALAALRLRSTNLGSENTLQTLSHMFGEELAREVMQDIGTPQKGFNNYILPRCGDCGACDLEGHCFYKEWRTLVGRLNEKMAANPIDQLALSNVFQTARSTSSR